MMKETKRMLQFLDSHNHELFTLTDGEAIQVITPEGIAVRYPCHYLDNTHMLVGGVRYSHLEYAKDMAALGYLYTPDRNRQLVEHYEIWQQPTLYEKTEPKAYEKVKGKLHQQHYQKVYQAVLASVVHAEDLLRWHQAEPHSSFKHLLSVSDLIVLKRKNHKECYYINPEGLLLIDEAFESR